VRAAGPFRAARLVPYLPGVTTSAYRVALRQPVSRRRELALQLGVLVAIAVLAGLLTLLGAWLHRGDERVGRREALLELARVLQPGEQVLARAEVAQRRWWDHFRTTPGVVVATDRRLVYVGTVPPALFRRTDDPPTFAEWSFPYDTALAARLGRGVAGAGQGLVVDVPGGETVRLGVRGDQRPRAAAVVAAVEARREEQVAELERQQAVFDSIAALPPPPPQLHRVRPGETLYGIAAAYNVTPEVLQSMNGLTTDRIRIGQELVVRRFRRINGAVVEYYGPR
jgi:LysM repeat protein